MLNSFLRHKRHIKPRVFAMLLLLLLGVFLSIFFLFNLFVRRYIRSNVEDQLSDLTSHFVIAIQSPQGFVQDGSYLPNLSGQQRSRIGARGEVFIIASDYRILGYNEFSVAEGAAELEKIAQSLKSKKVDLSSASYVNVSTQDGEYYVSSVKDILRPGIFYVFYVSVAGINNLVGAINAAMAAIVAFAMATCFLVANIITNSVTKPLKKLSAFADDIGKGNFKRRDFEFPDIEFDELGEIMNQSAEKLEGYDKDQRTFFQNVSHELRTPLQSIRCYAEGLEYGLMDPEKSGSTIVMETDRLAELVEDLLYISRVDSITNQVEKCENDLRDTLALAAQAQKSVADKSGIAFEYVFDEGPVLFSYSEKHMYRAFSNLISNALRYASSKVVLKCGQAEGGVLAEIIDDGPGIAESDRPHIFERFYKGEGGKHGIGLSIVKSVIELHQGTITAASGDGETRFSAFFKAS